MKRISSATLAKVVGVMDSLPIFSYALFAVVPVPGQLSPIAVKLILLALYGKQVRGFARLEFSFLYVLFFLVILSLVIEVWSPPVSVQSYLNYTAFILSVGLSLALVNADKVNEYLRAVILVASIAAFLHFGLALLGQTETLWGRYKFIRYGHPNAGGAVAAITVIAAALSYSKERFLLVAMVMTALVITLQSRASFAVIVSVTTIHTISAYRLSRSSTIFLVCLSAALLLALSDADILDWIIRYILMDVLQVDSETRGIHSGFTGRVDRWRDGAELFLEHIWLGVGLSFYYMTDGYTPHNAFLKSLAIHGLMASLLWMTVLASLVKVSRFDLGGAAIIGCGGMLLFFYEPFIDLNFYPFCFYFIILKYAAFIGGRSANGLFSADARQRLRIF